MPIFNDQNFNDMLTNNIISFERLGPEIFILKTIILFQEGESNCNSTGCQVPHFVIALIPYINLLNSLLNY